jgi:hypothetical protein
MAFISYRRNDAAGHAGRLYDHLVEAFGDGAAFLDTDAVAAGGRWDKRVEAAVATSKVVLALIGLHWQPGRLLKKDDPVRRELEYALSRSIPVIPVLVDGATLPPSDNLPPALRPILRHDAAFLDHANYRSYANDLDDLASRIRDLVAPTSEVSITRVRSFIGLFFDFIVVVDDQIVGVLGNGDSKRFEVASGHRRLRVATRGDNTSNEISFTIGPEASRHFVCHYDPMVMRWRAEIVLREA